VTVAYGDTIAVSGVDLDVSAGTWIGLIGPNGAGKTSLLKALAGMVPFSGSLELLGRSSSDFDRRERARTVAIVPQSPELPAGVSVIDYVLLGRTPFIRTLGTERAADISAAAEVLEELDLTELWSRPLTSLSGGETQRAVLARALVQGAPILLLDEPTTSLDVGRQQEVLSLIDGLRRDRGLTVVSALHDLTLAGQFTDRLLLMNGGAMAAEGSPREVLTNATIGEHYGATVRVIEDGDGGVIVIPVRPQGDAATASGPATAEVAR
jgi:iron complex transport system ATP-binding protein